MTRLVHLKREPYDIRIDRASVWGNPYEIGRDGTREEVIEKYRDYILGRPDLMGRLEELRGKVLGCWCVPKACHGEVLIQLMELLGGRDEEDLQGQMEPD